VILKALVTSEIGLGCSQWYARTHRKRNDKIMKDLSGTKAQRGLMRLDYTAGQGKGRIGYA